MKHIAIIGASGATGSEVVRLALKANYKITVVERNPYHIEPKENLSVVKGDVTNADSLVEAFKNTDIVISCFGPANGRKAGNLMSVGTANIVKACEENGVKRFVFMSGILQTDGKELSFFDRLGIKLIRQFYKGVYKDKIVAETAIRHSSLNWVIVRSVGLSKTEAKGKYMAGPKLKVSPFNALSYTDCALCLLNAAEEIKWTKQIINVGKI